VTNDTIDRIVREPEAKKISGLGRTQRHVLEKRGEFPQRVKISDRASGYRLSELRDWLESRPRSGQAA
jgi:prophage regulatory protein